MPIFTLLVFISWIAVILFFKSLLAKKNFFSDAFPSIKEVPKIFDIFFLFLLISSSLVFIIAFYEVEKLTSQLLLNFSLAILFCFLMASFYLRDSKK